MALKKGSAAWVLLGLKSGALQLRPLGGAFLSCRLCWRLCSVQAVPQEGRKERAAQGPSFHSHFTFVSPALSPIFLRGPAGQT